MKTSTVVLAMKKVGLRIERQLFLEDEVIFTEVCLPPQIAGSHRRPSPGDDEDEDEDEDDGEEDVIAPDMSAYRL